jgi:alpha-galactosidase
MREPLNVVLVGAGSPQWGYKMSRDLIVQLSSKEIVRRFAPTLVLEDLDETQLLQQVRLARRIAKAVGNRVRIVGTTDQRRAMAGARFVVVSFAVGSLEAMAGDLTIPQEYGIYMPVGDTVSIGGAIRAARNIPALLSIARDLEDVGHPDAWMLNISNPMSTLCRAVTRETRVRTVGCCHELYGGMRTLARWLGFDGAKWRSQVKVDVLGINHCSWMSGLRIGRRDGLKGLRKYLEGRGVTKASRRLYNSACPDLTRSSVKINLFLRHGVLPYSGDRHNVEFFTEFVNRDTNLGADYGVLLTSIQERLVVWRGGSRQSTMALIAGEEPIDPTISEEAASRIIRAVLLDEPFYDVGNLPYRGGSLPGVPQGAVLERMSTFSASGAVPDEVAPLPKRVMDHLILHAGIIEDVVEACVSGNRKLLVAAMRRDPLLQNMKGSKIPEMVGRLLSANRRFVHPEFF